MSGARIDSETGPPREGHAGATTLKSAMLVMPPYFFAPPSHWFFTSSKQTDGGLSPIAMLIPVCVTA